MFGAAPSVLHLRSVFYQMPVISLQLIKLLCTKYYLGLYIWIINYRTRPPLSNSGNCLHIIRKPVKQSTLDFSKVKYIVVSIQFIVIDSYKFCFSYLKSNNLESNVGDSLPIL